MKIKKRLTALLLVLVMPLLSSCSVDLLGGNNILMRPPRLSGEREGIQRALEDFVPNFILKYPKSGDNRSAFVSSDLDGDGNNDIVAFYQPVGKESLVHINLIGRDENGYRSLSDVEGFANEVHSVAFEDLDRDGCAEILVSWPTANSSNRRLTIYGVLNGKLALRLDQYYTEMVLADITGDSMRDLLLITNSPDTQPIAKANLIEMLEHSGGRIASTLILNSLYPPSANTSPYLSVKVGKLRDDGTTAVFLDGLNGSSPSGSTTEIIVCENGRLRHLLPTILDSTPDNMYRPQVIACTDINNDGWIEVPVLRTLPGYADKPMNERLYLTSWYRYDGRVDSNGNDAQLVLNCFMNPADGYYYRFPDEWVSSESVTIRRDASTRSITFFALDATHEYKLMGIQAFSIAAWEQNTDPTYHLITQTDTTVYAFFTYNFDGNTLDLKKVAPNFFLIPS